MPGKNPPKNAPISYQSAVIEAILSDQAAFWSVTDLIKHVTEKHPLQPDRRAIQRAVDQLIISGLIKHDMERRFMNLIPVNVYKYNSHV